MRKVSLQFWFALTILIVIISASVLAPVLSTYNPFEPDMTQRLMGPSLEHILGTDALGRDMYARILYGGRVSILLALVAAFFSLVIGLGVGIFSGFYRGKVDIFFTVLSNIFQGIPGSCFMIAIAGILGPSIYSLIVALVITSWAGFSRIVRAEVLQVKEEPFIEGLRCLGCGDGRLIIMHILPNIINKLLAFFTIRIGKGILSIAGMSFLGLGVQPPMPDWSVMIHDSILYYRSAPHLIIVPGMCMFLLIYSINILGDEIRNKLDVRYNEVRKWE